MSMLCYAMVTVMNHNCRSTLFCFLLCFFLFVLTVLICLQQRGLQTLSHTDMHTHCPSVSHQIIHSVGVLWLYIYLYIYIHIYRHCKSLMHLFLSVSTSCWDVKVEICLTFYGDFQLIITTMSICCYSKYVWVFKKNFFISCQLRLDWVHGVEGGMNMKCPSGHKKTNKNTALTCCFCFFQRHKSLERLRLQSLPYTELIFLTFTRHWSAVKLKHYT